MEDYAVIEAGIKVVYLNMHHQYVISFRALKKFNYDSTKKRNT